MRSRISLGFARTISSRISSRLSFFMTAINSGENVSAIYSLAFSFSSRIPDKIQYGYIAAPLYQHIDQIHECVYHAPGNIAADRPDKHFLYPDPVRFRNTDGTGKTERHDQTE